MSSLSKAVFLKQALSLCSVFTPFAKDRTKDASPVVSLCTRFVDLSVVWLCLAGACRVAVSTWALALSGDCSVMSRIRKRRILSTGWIVVSSKHRLYSSLESSALDSAGVTRNHHRSHPRAGPLSPLILKQTMAHENYKAHLRLHWQTACTSEQWGGSSSSSFTGGDLLFPTSLWPSKETADLGLIPEALPCSGGQPW